MSKLACTIQGDSILPSQEVIEGAYSKVTRHLIPFIFLSRKENDPER